MEYGLLESGEKGSRVESGIYEIICTASKWTTYVGSSQDIKTRWRKHRNGLRGGYHPNPHLQNAWNLYGKDAFLFEVIEYCPVDKLTEREQFWLDGIRQFVPVFNIAEYTEAAMRGRTHTPETKAKISAAGMGRVASEEARAKMSAAQKGNTNCLGYHHTPEHRAKISAALKGRPRSDEHIANVAVAHAKPYPAFIHEPTGRIIPEGKNLAKLCQEHPDSLSRSAMWGVAHGQHKSHKGWRLLIS